MSSELPESVADALRWLQGIARTVNGCTSPDAWERRVSVVLAQLLAELHQRHHVSTPELARACGVTHAAVQMRIRRHGYAPPYASQASVYGEQPWKQPVPKAQPPRTHCGVCRLELAGDNLGVRGDGRRYCKACNSRHARERYARVGKTSATRRAR